jgi:hypothetical protein
MTSEHPTPPEPPKGPDAPADDSQDILPFDDLADLEFLLEGIEDKIAPLA